MNARTIKHVESGRILIVQAKWCDTFMSRMRGFTLRRHRHKTDGLVLVQSVASRVDAAITMLFVFFDLGVFWLNEQGEVVDKVLAKSWRLIYTPAKAAKYTVEGDPSLLDQVQIGDHLQFLPPESS